MILEDFKQWTKKFPDKVRMTIGQKEIFLKDVLPTFSDEEKAAAAFDWKNLWGRDEQLPWYWAEDTWREWLYIAGRGAGKTKSGAEWVRDLLFNVHKGEMIIIGVVCPTNSDIDAVIVNGPSGIMSCLTPWEREQVNYLSTLHKLQVKGPDGTFENGSVVRFYSAESGERLRGKGWMYAWLDELAAWQDLDEVLFQCGMCLRVNPPRGLKSKRVITTTPKPFQWLRNKLLKEAPNDPEILVTRGSSYDNKQNLNATMFKELIKYEGTQIGRQEIYGQLIGEADVGIIKRSWLKFWAHDKPLPKLEYVFASYDNGYTTDKKGGNDPTACVIAGLFLDIDNEYSIIFLDAWQEWLEYADLRVQIMQDWEASYGEESPDGSDRNIHRMTAMVIENKASGQALLGDIYRTGVKMIKFNCRDDKLVRIHTVSYLPKDGRIYILESSRNPGNPVPYLVDFVEELVNFPLVEHDDYCDAFTQLLILFMKNRLITGELTKRDLDDEDDSDEEERRFRHNNNPYLN
jgi:predicted phage terminase large subunit-like protein